MSPYRAHAQPRRDVLACSGLDPSGGAGLLADARVIAELGARPIGVVTMLTIQNTTGARVSCSDVASARATSAEPTRPIFTACTSTSVSTNAS